MPVRPPRKALKRETASPAACRLAPEKFWWSRGVLTSVSLNGMEARGVEPLTARCERAVLPTIPRPLFDRAGPPRPARKINIRVANVGRQVARRHQSSRARATLPPPRGVVEESRGQSGGRETRPTAPRLARSRPEGVRDESPHAPRVARLR